MAAPRPDRRPPLLLWGLALAALAAGLAATNPGPAAFEEYAGIRLSGLIRQELCQEDGLPLMLRLVIQDCPAAVESQRPVLGRLARLHSRRRNLGLFSLYVTALGGQRILPHWQLPRYHALTLAVAGQFLVLRAAEQGPADEAPRQAWLPGGGW